MRHPMALCCPIGAVSLGTAVDLLLWSDAMVPVLLVALSD